MGLGYKINVPDHARGRVIKTLFILPLQMEGKYISSNGWLLGSFFLPREPTNLRESDKDHVCDFSYVIEYHFYKK